MEKHFLGDCVDGEPVFSAEPWYNVEGDCIVYQTANEEVVADRIDDILTVYRSAVDNRPIGFQIKGVSAIVRQFGLDGLEVCCEERGGRVNKISVSALLLAAYETGPRTIGRRKAYACAMREAPELSMREIAFNLEMVGS